MTRLRQAFLDFGYKQPTMARLAKACDLTRRSLYNHFHRKEEAYRAVLRWRHRQEIAAGRREIEAGASAVAILAAVFEARFGDTRRDLERSPL